MRLRSSLFWGLVLIVLAVLLLLHQLGMLQGDIFGYFWPAIVILFGIWLIVGALGRGGQAVAEGTPISIPLEGANSAYIKLEHGAGRLNIRAGASSDEIIHGVFGGEVVHKTRFDGNRLDVKLHTSSQFLAWMPGDSLNWDIALNREIPISLDIDNGASASTLDLSDLKITDLDIDTGASSTEVTLPANAGNTRVEINSGASSVSLRIPTGVAARIRVKSGIASINVDSVRFPRLDGGIYQSADYVTAANRADITIETGVGSVEIK